MTLDYEPLALPWQKSTKLEEAEKVAWEFSGGQISALAWTHRSLTGWFGWVEVTDGKRRGYFNCEGSDLACVKAECESLCGLLVAALGLRRETNEGA